jgi:hypothetical protein
MDISVLCGVWGCPLYLNICAISMSKVGALQNTDGYPEFHDSIKPYMRLPVADGGDRVVMAGDIGFINA